MIREGKFPPPHKIGRNSFWRLEDVEAFLKNI
jgi:predicted DNA-binding transcriptional regulator AlpA